jgi:hypothetical protein
LPIALVTSGALAGERPLEIRTDGVGLARVVQAFVHVCALKAAAGEALGARARVVSVGIATFRGVGAGVQIERTFIDVHAALAVPSVAANTNTHGGAVDIGASSVLPALKLGLFARRGLGDGKPQGDEGDAFRGFTATPHRELRSTATAFVGRLTAALIDELTRTSARKEDQE